MQQYQNGYFAAAEHCCGAKSKITVEIAVYLVKKLEEDNEVTSMELQTLIARNPSL